MAYPRISIITPSFNQGKYIQATLESVQAQGYPDYEHIVMDGGSHDNTCNILQAQTDTLTYWESTPDRGQSHAINKGLERSTGHILTWLNSDDQLMPETLFRVAEQFERNPELDLLYGDCILFDEQGNERLSKPENHPERLLGGMTFAQPASFFSRRAYERFAPLSEALNYAMDYHFFLPMALEGNTHYLPHTLARYLYHTESKSVTHNADFAREYGQVLQKLLQTFPEQSQEWQSKLRQQGFWLPELSVPRYELEADLQDEQLRQAVFYNLVSQAKYFYAALELREVRKRLSWLRQEMPDLFGSEPQLESTLRRTQWLPAPLMRLLRTLRR